LAACSILVLCSGCKTFLPWCRKADKPVLLGPRAVVPPPYGEPAPAKPDTAEVAPPTAPAMPAAPELAVITPVEPPKPKSVDLPPPVKSELLTYKLKKNETLWDVSLMYGVTVQEIMAVNKIKAGDERRLKVGTALRIPPGGRFIPPEKRPKIKPRKQKKGPKAAGKAPAKQAAVAPPPPDGKYSVKKGDSLWLIARRFGTTSDAIRSLNNLASDVLQVNQVLVIPKSDKTPAKPVPAKAKPAAGKPAAGKPAAGKPAGEPAKAAAAKAPAGKAPASALPFPKVLEHTVGEGETLEIIAEMYDTKVEHIRTANPTIKTNADLKVNMKIRVPYH